MFGSKHKILAQELAESVRRYITYRESAADYDGEYEQMLGALEAFEELP